MDELSNLEINLEKLSSLFFLSLDEVRRHAPLINLANEESMENTKLNQNRIDHERIENYEIEKERLPERMKERSSEINETFGKVNDILNQLNYQGEFNKTEDELKKNLKDLKNWNELKIKSVSEKMKFMDDLIGNIKKEASSIIDDQMID
jgi:hypothetical protein